MADSSEDDIVSVNLRKKQATLYDAVAGRVGYEGFLTEQHPSKYRDTASTSIAAIPPDEVLFRRKDAPVRYGEDDLYAADRHLQPHQQLPDSDLLKAIHTYTADFYSCIANDQRQIDTKSMDETALIAMGILLEEAAASTIGSTGDLAFVESAENDVGEIVSGSDAYLREGRWRRSVISQPTTGKSLKRRRGESQYRSANPVAIRPKG